MLTENISFKRNHYYRKIRNNSKACQLIESPFESSVVNCLAFDGQTLPPAVHASAHERWRQCFVPIIHRGSASLRSLRSKQSVLTYKSKPKFTEDSLLVHKYPTIICYHIQRYIIRERASLYSIRDCNLVPKTNREQATPSFQSTIIVVNDCH